MCDVERWQHDETVLAMSDKYDSVNERTQEISESVKLHMLGV